MTWITVSDTSVTWTAETDTFSVWATVSDDSQTWLQQSPLGEVAYAKPDYYVYGYVDEQETSWPAESDQGTTWQLL